MASLEDQNELKNEPEVASTNSTDQEAEVKIKGSKRHRKLLIGIIIAALMLIFAVIPITVTSFLQNQRQGPQSLQGESTLDPFSTDNSTYIPVFSSISTSSSSTPQTNSNNNNNNNSPTSRPLPFTTSTTPRESTRFNPTQSLTCNQIAGYQRFDCIADTKQRSQSTCLARGCCWNPTSEPKNAPPCYYPPNYGTFYGRQVQNVSYGQRLIVNRPSNQPIFYQSPVTSLQVDIQHQTASRLRIKVKY